MRYLKYLIFICFLTGCRYEYIKTDIVRENRLIIDKININEKYNISSIDDFVNGIVMFDETGRPDIKNTNTVIGAHSGYGSNAYFNNLNKLETNDIIKLIYNNIEYKYLINDIKIIDENDISVLNNSDFNQLTLLTCKIGDNTKRIIVISTLIE